MIRVQKKKEVLEEGYQTLKKLKNKLMKKKEQEKKSLNF